MDQDGKTCSGSGQNPVKVIGFLLERKGVLRLCPGAGRRLTMPSPVLESPLFTSRCFWSSHQAMLRAPASGVSDPFFPLPLPY